MVQATVEAFGSLDIIISNAGWTKFVKFGDLKATTDDDWDKVCLLQPISGSVSYLADCLPVLGCQRQGTALFVSRSLPIFQRQQ